MKKSVFLVSLAALTLGTGPAFAAQDAKAQPRAEIPFANHDGIWNWTAGENDSTVYFQDQRRQWYKATLISPAFDLSFANGIRIDAGPTGTLDKWGAIIVGRQRYPFTAFEKVDGPPVRARKAKVAKDGK